MTPDYSSAPSDPKAGPPPLRGTWIVVRVFFFAVLAIWVLIGSVMLVGVVTADEDADGTVDCPAGSYPASAGHRHACFPNGTAPPDGFTADPMTEHQGKGR